MSAQTERELHNLVRAERWKMVCTWCFVLGAVVLLTALFMAVGGGGVGNPKTASSIFSAFMASGRLREFAAPTAALGLVFVVAGLLAGVIARRSHEP